MGGRKEKIPLCGFSGTVNFVIQGLYGRCDIYYGEEERRHCKKYLGIKCKGRYTERIFEGNSL